MVSIAASVQTQIPSPVLVWPVHLNQVTQTKPLYFIKILWISNFVRIQLGVSAVGVSWGWCLCSYNQLTVQLQVGRLNKIQLCIVPSLAG